MFKILIIDSKNEIFIRPGLPVYENSKHLLLNFSILLFIFLPVYGKFFDS